MKRFFKLSLLSLLSLPLSQLSIACICMNNRAIDSLPQLKEYDMIALVTVASDKDLPGDGFDAPNGIFNIKVIELFKGKENTQIFEYAKNSSCDIGISKGQEWVLFAKMINGKLCVTACDRNIKYKDIDGLRDWKYGSGFYELKRLRKLYQHPDDIFQTGEHKEYYPNGKVEIEENYLDGKKNGHRRIWYPTGQLFCDEFYINDSLDGKASWFYESGQVYQEDYYIKGKHCNISALYYDTSMYEVFKTKDSLDTHYQRLQAEYETIYDLEGNAIIQREYTEFGKIRIEKITDPTTKITTGIYYKKNGTIEAIEYFINDAPYGHYQHYSEDGFPDNGWDYDANGNKVIKH